MSCVRRIALASVLVLLDLACAFESPVSFAGFASAVPGGPAGWNSNPAGAHGGALAASTWWRGSGPSERAASLSASWKMGVLGGAFVYDYYSLDSTFRQSYAMLEASLSFWKLKAGAAWGPVAEWVPGDAAWLRYRVKFGLLGRLGRFALSSWWSGFVDEKISLPWVGIFWESTGNFSAFAVSDFESVSFGTSVRIGVFSIEASYAFPGFGLDFGISVAWGGLLLGAEHGIRDEIGDWNGVWAVKRINK